MPYLKLKIVSGSEIGQNNNYSFTHLGGSIGRSEYCDWTLLDSDRFVSKKHLVITYKNHQYVLTDVSSNGVIINSAAEPLGRGNEHIFQATDTLVIGKHIVQVEDINVDIEDVNPFQTQQDNGDLMGLITGTSAPSEPTHIAMQEPPALFKIPESRDIFSEFNSEDTSGLEDILSTPIQSTAVNECSNFNEQSNPFNISTPSITPVNNASEKDALIINTEADNSLIPDDWEMFDTMSPVADFKPPTENNISVNPADIADSLDTNLHDNILAPLKANQNPSEILTEKDTSLLDENPLAMVESALPASQETQSLLIPSHQEAMPQHIDNNKKSVATKEISNTTTDDFFTSLYEKLGLSKEFKASINRETFAEDIATILLSTTQGLMSLLASRTAFKQESRLSSTLIQPRSNNPIKFSIDPVDTLEMLLVKKKKGYMSVGSSYNEAMEDIQLHQMAFMSGLQGTLNGVLAQLDPEDIEKQVGKKSQRFMGFNSNSQCWQVYKEKQPLLAKSVRENINEVLGTYFSDAYQSQINSFKSDK
jgi:type VI secretion system protein